jgi:hypothetical protein
MMNAITRGVQYVMTVNGQHVRERMPFPFSVSSLSRTKNQNNRTEKIAYLNLSSAFAIVFFVNASGSNTENRDPESFTHLGPSSIEFPLPFWFVCADAYFCGPWCVLNTFLGEPIRPIHNVPEKVLVPWNGIVNYMCRLGLTLALCHLFWWCFGGDFWSFWDWGYY